MNIAELRTKDKVALNEELIALCKERFNLRMLVRTSQNANTARLKGVRRDIARIKTVMTENKKELQNQNASTVEVASETQENS